MVTFSDTYEALSGLKNQIRDKNCLLTDGMLKKQGGTYFAASSKASTVNHMHQFSDKRIIIHVYNML